MNFMDSYDSGHAPPLGNFVRFRVRTVAGNMRIKFEVHSFECIGFRQGSTMSAIDARANARTHKHK